MLYKACLPAAAISNKELNDTDRRVLLGLSVHEKNGKVEVSRDQLSHVTGLLPRNISRATTKLQLRNWIIKAGSTHQVTYFINWNWPEKLDMLVPKSGTNSDKLGIDSGTNTKMLVPKSGTNSDKLGIDSGTNTKMLVPKSGTNSDKLGIDSGTNTKMLVPKSGTNSDKLGIDSGTNEPENNNLWEQGGTHIYINNIYINKQIYINTITRENVFNFIAHYKLKIPKQHKSGFNSAIELWTKENVSHVVFHGACKRAEKHATNKFINPNYMEMLINSEKESLEAQQNDTNTKDFTEASNYDDATSW